MLQNMKLGVRLGLGFAVVLLLLLLASGVGIYNLSNFKDVTNVIVNHVFPKVALVNDTIKNTLDNGRQVRNVALSTNQADIEEYFKKMEANRKKNGENLDKLDKLLTLP
ncbi:MAG: MCP four helix bundle domain-containing protein [Nitrospirota bacterium]|nr:MCP four helix bundle domain-containing protein [Nitrospirota bacterium]